MTYPTHTMEYRTLAENRLENVALVEAMLNQNAISSVRVSGQNAGLHGHLAVRFWVLLAILAVGMLIASSASGQAPAAVGRPLSPEITTKAKVSAMERAKAEGLTKADLTPSWPGYTAFQAYYQQYLFGKLMDPAYVAEYGSVMQALLDDLDRAHKNGSPAVKLISDWIVSGASAIAAGNYHPAARVNATLLLAYVDKEAVRGRPPVPAPTALVPLVMLYRADTNPDGVRAAALQGLLRHVKLDAVSKPEHKSGIAGLMLQLAESQPPAGRSPEAHAFMQRYAIDILNFLANPGVTPKTAETLVSLSTTPEKPSLIAAYAASKIGQLKPGQAKVKEPTKVLSSWAARAAATIDKELDRIAKLDPPVAVRDQPAMPSVQTPMAGGAYGGDMYGSGPMGGEMGPGMTESYGSGGMDDMMGGMYDMSGMYGGDMYGPGMMLPKANPQPSEVIAARRQINHVLQQLQHGVTGQQVTGVPRTPGGLLGSATENDKAAFDNWISTVGDVATAINQETLDDRKKFVEELKKQSIALKQLAGIPVDPAEAVAAAPLAVEAVDPAVGALGPGVAAPGNASGPALPAGQVPGASAAPAAGAIVPTPSDDLLQ